nr:MAG TPA: hypothetical protein [Caudoviricetes sp.]
MSKRENYEKWCSNLNFYVRNEGSESEKKLATLLTFLSENCRGVGDIKAYPGMIEVNSLIRGNDRDGTITIKKDGGYFFHGNMHFKGIVPEHDYTFDIYVPQIDPVTEKTNKGYFVWDNFLKALYDLFSKGDSNRIDRLFNEEILEIRKVK